jgi:hypothetical protein
MKKLTSTIFLALFLAVMVVTSAFAQELSPYLIAAEVLAEPLPDLLRAAKPDFTGGAVPESTMGKKVVSVQILRVAKPDFDGGFVPDSTMEAQPIPVDVLRAAKPDFNGGFLPEPTVGE